MAKCSFIRLAFLRKSGLEIRFMSNEDLTRLCGWAIREWSLIPSHLVTMNLLNFQMTSSGTDDRRVAKLLFSSPTRVEFRNITRAYGQEIFIEDVASLTAGGGSQSFEIATSRGGKILIVAREASLLLL